MKIVKWAGLTLFALIIVAAVLAVTGKKTFRVETYVDSPPEAVWAVVSDAATYPNWNPVFIAVDGAFSEGATVATTVQQPGMDPVQMTSEVVSITPGREIHQRLGMPVIITSDHRWIIEPQGNGTLIIQDEVDVGLMVWFWNSDWVDATYREANEALGAYAARN